MNNFTFARAPLGIPGNRVRKLKDILFMHHQPMSCSKQSKPIKKNKNGSKSMKNMKNQSKTIHGKA